jgi:hypothetical protein
MTTSQQECVLVSLDLCCAYSLVDIVAQLCAPVTSIPLLHKVLVALILPNVIVVQHCATTETSVSTVVQQQ